MEAVLPIEVEIPSMRILAKVELEEAEWARQRYEQLNLIDEKRLKALCHGQCYQQRMARAFNAKAHHREFSPGDLVLRKVLHVTPDSRGKFSYKYDGAIGNPKGCSLLTDSYLPHATGCALDTSETVEGCTILSNHRRPKKGKR
ncbi:hypothetical protein CRG98_017818 [Punica granatum]|uniref:Uncharacterized protein n=1 Tax=Punica granatum TaxID=22663 RepID=A0A2I0JZM7_PUNGR|nr:hypothetical protein CRG98_017818 [Punica granatum]